MPSRRGKKVNLIIAPMFMMGTILAYDMKGHEFAVIAVEGNYDMDVVWVIFDQWLRKKRMMDPAGTKSSGFPYWESIDGIIIFMDGMFKSAVNALDIEYQTMMVSRQFNVAVQLELVAPSLLSFFPPSILPGEGNFHTHVAFWKHMEHRAKKNNNVYYWTKGGSFIGYRMEYFDPNAGTRWHTCPPLRHIFMYSQLPPR